MCLRLNRKLQELEKDRQTCRSDDEEREQSIIGLRGQRDEMQNHRRALFKRDADLEESINYFKEKHTKYRIHAVSLYLTSTQVGEAIGKIHASRFEA